MVSLLISFFRSPFVVQPTSEYVDTSLQDSASRQTFRGGAAAAASCSTTRDTVTNTQLESDVTKNRESGEHREGMASRETTAVGTESLQDGTKSKPSAWTSRSEEVIEDNPDEDPKPRSTKKDDGESHGQRKRGGGGDDGGENEEDGSKRKSKSGGKAGPSNSRRKAFITLSYIVLAYVVCWSPFHFVFDVSLASTESVSADLYTAAFWLAYINSGSSSLPIKRLVAKSITETAWLVLSWTHTTLNQSVDQQNPSTPG